MPTPEEGFQFLIDLNRARPIDDQVRSLYPQTAWALNHPELGPLLRQAATERWDEGRLLGALQKTGWWQNTAASQREWTRLWAEDPKSARDKFDAGMLEVNNALSRLGLQAPNDWEKAIAATKFVTEGWDAQRLAAYLVGLGGATTFVGEISTTADVIRQRAAQYLMPMTQEAATTWARNVAQGQASMESMESYFRGTAKARFAGDPTITAALDQGITAKQLFDPMRQQTAQLLELSPDSVDFMDTRWMPMIDSVQSDGVRRPMSLSEAGQHVRGMEEYRSTSGAKQQAAALGEQILQTFGKVTGGN